jgi:hypothetical protein
VRRAYGQEPAQAATTQAAQVSQVESPQHIDWHTADVMPPTVQLW